MTPRVRSGPLGVALSCAISFSEELRQGLPDREIRPYETVIICHPLKHAGNEAKHCAAH